MNLDFNNMDDEQFRKEFMRFLNLYQSSMEDFIDKSEKKGNGLFLYNPLGFDENMIRKIINNINEDMSNKDDLKRQLPDNYMNSIMGYFNNEKSYNKEPKKLNTIDLLNKKLYQSISKEDYESAAKIRDLIESLKKDNVKEK